VPSSCSLAAASKSPSNRRVIDVREGPGCEKQERKVLRLSPTSVPLPLAATESRRMEAGVSNQAAGGGGRRIRRTKRIEIEKCPNVSEVKNERFFHRFS
jgi:hypothetical protein